MIFATLTVIFVVYEWKVAGPSAILPLRLFKNRTHVGSMISAFFSSFMLIVGIYYLPIYFQSAKGYSATAAGVALIPFMVRPSDWLSSQLPDDSIS